MTLVALGAIGGFGVFYSALQYRLEQTEHSHNATLAKITSRFVDSERERKRCSKTDEGRLQEISDLRGRLDAQHKSWHDLTVAQRSIVSDHQENVAQMQRFRDVYDQDQRTMESLEAKAKEKDRDLMALKEDIQHYHRLKIDLESELTKVRRANKEETQNLQVQMKNMDKQHEAQLQQFREEHTRNQQTLQSLQAHSEQKDRDLISIQEDLKRYSERKVQLETDLKNLQEAHREETRNLQVQMHHKDQELESLRNNLNLLSNQKDHLEKEGRQKDETIQSIKKKSDTLQYEIAEKRNRIENMELQILEKDKELLKYREEEGDLQTKLVNFREGMLGLLTEKIHEIQDLKEHVNSLNEEKADLELRLDNWREGMLTLVKEKIQEIDQLKIELNESQARMKTMIQEVEKARSEHVDAEKFVRDQLDVINQNSGPEQVETVQMLMQEVKQVRAELEESRKWVDAAMQEIERLKSNQAESETLIAEKTIEIQNLKLQIEREQEIAKEKFSELTSELEVARRSVEAETNQIEQLNSGLGGFVLEINDLKMGITDSNNLSKTKDIETIIHHVQQRDSVMCRQLYVTDSKRTMQWLILIFCDAKCMAYILLHGLLLTYFFLKLQFWKGSVLCEICGSTPLRQAQQ